LVVIMVGAYGKSCGQPQHASASGATVAVMAQPAPPPTPSERAVAQGGVLTRAQLVDALGEAGFRRAVRARDWQLVRRGAYAERPVAEAATRDARLQHRLYCAAQLLVARRGLVVSHSSAAVVHGMTLLKGYAGPPQLTCPRPAGTPPRFLRGVLTAGLPQADRELIDGLPVTTRSRTVADLARTLDRPAAVVMADSALRAGVERAAVLEALAACDRWPGVLRARELVAFADKRAESPLESLARLWFRDAGLPAPDLQVRLCDGADGRFVARVDFLWVAHRTVCEVDGRVKYEEAQDPDLPRPSNVLWQEKLREDTMRDLGLEVARGYWSDGRDDGRSLVERVRRAFARGHQRADRPTYGILASR
jgi:hypothetical protein